MHELTYLRDILVILAFAVVVVTVFHRFGLPSIAGLILTGIIVGPQGVGLINDTHHVELLAEIGVALLLFGIGIELELTKLKRIWRLALGGGVIQVCLTTLAAAGVCTAVGMTTNQAIFIGLTVSLSSTAIVLQGLQQRNEVDAPHGRLMLGILVFQDFSIVPIMLILPILMEIDSGGEAIILTLAKSVSIVVGVLLLAILIVPRILKLVARTRQRQLFILSVFVVCLGTAWLVTRSGASLAVGAFLAGLVVSGSEYRHQALAEMIAFRDIFSSLFFISVGMLLSPYPIFDNLGTISLILSAIILGKAAIVFLTATVVRMPPRARLIAALGLAQVGEFSFILLYAVQGSDLVERSLENNLLSAAVISMFITPFAISLGPRLAAGLGKFKPFGRMTEVRSAEEAPESLSDLSHHVIVAGYGFAGRILAQSLELGKIPYLVIDLNIENVRRASDETGRAIFGDITSDEVQVKLGIKKSRALVLLINDLTASERAVRVARSLVPDLTIVVRTMYLQDVDALKSAGANRVVSSEKEGAVQVVEQMMSQCGLPADQTVSMVRSIREEAVDE